MRFGNWEAQRRVNEDEDEAYIVGSGYVVGSFFVSESRATFSVKGLLTYDLRHCIQATRYFHFLMNNFT